MPTDPTPERVREIAAGKFYAQSALNLPFTWNGPTLEEAIALARQVQVIALREMLELEWRDGWQGEGSDWLTKMRAAIDADLRARLDALGGG